MFLSLCRSTSSFNDAQLECQGFNEQNVRPIVSIGFVISLDMPMPFVWQTDASGTLMTYQSTCPNEYHTGDGHVSWQCIYQCHTKHTMHVHTGKSLHVSNFAHHLTVLPIVVHGMAASAVCDSK